MRKRLKTNQTGSACYVARSDGGGQHLCIRDRDRRRFDQRSSNRAAGLSRYQRFRSTAQSDGLQEPDGGRFLHRHGYKVDAVADWYSKELAGFKKYHAIADGRSQDTFFNSDGTQEVTVTGQAWRSRCVLDFLTAVSSPVSRRHRWRHSTPANKSASKFARCPNHGNIACFSPASCRHLLLSSCMFSSTTY